MQDIHWSDASIGYFPSYALGNVYGAQILDTMRKEIPYDDILASGNLDKIRDWFAKRDFFYDYQDPNDWIKTVTGKAADPKYFIDYLTKKYL